VAMGRDLLGESQRTAKWTWAWFACALVCMPFEGVFRGFNVEQGEMAAIPKNRAEMDDMLYRRISRQDCANSICFVNLCGKGE
jgi:hypothetical protein